MDWVRGSKLGHGSFAAVSLAVPGKHSVSFLPPLMAVKSCGASHSASLAKEKMILDELKDCAQVIQCFGDDFTCENGERLYNVLLEYAPGGSLHDKISDSDEKKLPEIEVRRYTKALIRGLSYIHKVGYVHCDIKLQNILLCADGSVKIADFGLAKGLDSDDRRSCELRGTPLYMSPEMVTGGEQGPPADVWALGCVVAEMASGAPLWRCATPAEMLLKIGVGDELPEVPATLSDDGRDFLERCFARDPKKRWTAEMLLDHPFVRGQDFDFNFDQNDVYGFAGVSYEKDELLSPSPRCPFDFPSWASSSSDTCSVITTSLPLPGAESWSSWSDVAAERLGGLVSQRGPNWSDSDDWVTIR